jgi:hypothetical protein
LEQGNMTELETTVERLKAEATERWGEHWVIKVSRFADGDLNAYAMHSLGRNEDGHLVQDRLYLINDDEVLVSRRTLERREISSELIEAPPSET